MFSNVVNGLYAVVDMLTKGFVEGIVVGSHGKGSPFWSNLGSMIVAISTAS